MIHSWKCEGFVIPGLSLRFLYLSPLNNRQVLIRKAQWEATSRQDGTVSAGNQRGSWGSKRGRDMTCHLFLFSPPFFSSCRFLLQSLIHLSTCQSLLTGNTLSFCLKWVFLPSGPLSLPLSPSVKAQQRELSGFSWDLSFFYWDHVGRKAAWYCILRGRCPGASVCSYSIL